MATRRLLLIAVLLLAIVNIWYFSGYLRSSIFQQKAERLDVRPPVTRLESLTVFPAATRANLLIKNSTLTGPERLTNPNGVDLTVLQRGEFQGAIKKRVTVRPAGKDHPIASGSGCFIPHHFFRYYDASGKKVGEIEICFCCEGGSAIPSLTPRNDESEVFDIERIKALVKSMNLPTEVGC
jgi:hypothetical protein